MPGLARLGVLFQQIVEALVRQLHDDDEFALQDLNLIHRQNERMANGLDPFDRFEFLLGLRGVAVDRVQVAEHELHRFVDAAGGDALPHFAEAACAERFDESIAGNRFGIGFAKPTHFTYPVWKTR